MTTTYRVWLVAAGLTFSISAASVAQECLGITAGSRGYVAYGIEGTDGVTGEALTVGVRLRDFNLQLHGRSMDPGGFTFASGVAGSMRTVELQAAHPITRKLPLCVFSGLGWTGYDIERVNAGQRTTHDYMQLRVPLGVSLGKEFKLTDNLRVSTFVQNAALYEFEKFEREQNSTSNRHTLGIGMTAGLGLSYGPLLLRSTISNYKTLGSSAGLYNDFPYMSLQLGVKF